MKLKEIGEIEKCTNEGKLIEVLEEIGDKVVFRGYQEERILSVEDQLESDLKEYVTDFFMYEGI